jgi:hypothetical protein
MGTKDEGAGKGTKATRHMKVGYDGTHGQQHSVPANTQWYSSIGKVNKKIETIGGDKT